MQHAAGGLTSLPPTCTSVWDTCSPALALGVSPAHTAQPASLDHTSRTHQRRHSKEKSSENQNPSCHKQLRATANPSAETGLLGCWLHGRSVQGAASPGSLCPFPPHPSPLGSSPLAPTQPRIPFASITGGCRLLALPGPCIHHLPPLQADPSFHSSPPF